MPRALVIESDHAYDLAHELAERLGMTVDEVVREALQMYALSRGFRADGSRKVSTGMSCRPPDEDQQAK